MTFKSSDTASDVGASARDKVTWAEGDGAQGALPSERATLLLRRLDEIGASLSSTPGTLALIGLGSVGAELERIDEFSDLDFFVIVDQGYKDEFIRDVAWLDRVAPIDFWFQNTDDGHKVLFSDGVYAEYAIFTEAELARFTVSGGRVVWQAASLTLSTEHTPPNRQAPRATEWVLGELLTNLYVGLLRFRRGELLAAHTLIQRHAVDRLLELCDGCESPSAGTGDRYDRSRRFEQRFPGLANEVQLCMQGYARSVESARAMLTLVERHFPVNGALKSRILALVGRQEGSEGL